jgi:hypothetical protein
MAINSPIIDAGPTVQKVDTLTVIAPLIEVATPGSFDYLRIVDGVPDFGTVQPQWEGQLLFVKLKDVLQVTIFIAIEDNSNPGVFAWKEVVTGVTFEDPRTGETRDPLYELYF